MFLPMDDQRLAGRDAGADAVGAFLRLRPNGAEIQAGLLKLLLEAGLA